MKKIAILQSNYIPWKGYFDLIAAVDEFVIFDDMQYTRRDWRNRNQIKTPQGVQWLTVPVSVKGKYHQKIRDTKIDLSKWQADHWRAWEQNYKRAKYFDDIASWLQPLYLEREYLFLTDLNLQFLKSICQYLKIGTKLTFSWDYELKEDKSNRLLSICQQAGASEYLSGPSAKDYLDENLFKNHNMKVTWFDYAGYPEYPQLWGEFSHGVSILDLLFNCGPQSNQYMRHDIS